VKEAEEKKDKEKPKADRREGQEGRAEGRRGRRRRHRLRRPRHPKGPAHHSLLAAERRAVEQGGETPLLPRALREERQPVVHEPADQGNEDARCAERQRRQHGVGQGPEEHLPAGRRHALEDRFRPAPSARASASAARSWPTRRPSGRPCSTTSGGARATRSTRRATTASTGSASAPSTRSTCRTSATLRVLRDAQRDARRCGTSATAARRSPPRATDDDATAALGVFYDQTYTGAG